MTIKAGILSDTHLAGVNPEFAEQVEQCFGDCDIIIHAGDLTSPTVLDVFAGREVYAVHGNMCNHETSRTLPRETTFILGKFTIGLTHGAHLGRGIENQLWNLFPEADCMVYGHTHQAVCHRQGGALIINPGTFRSTGRFGAPGTYAILEAGTELTCSLHEVVQNP